MDDPDAMGAVGKVWVHWVIWNINPDTGQVDGYIDDPEGMTDFGERLDMVDQHLLINGTHMYSKLYALDIRLDLPDRRSTKARMLKMQ